MAGSLCLSVAEADVIVFYNGTPDEIEFTVAEENGSQRPRSQRPCRIESGQVVPISVSRKAEITFLDREENRRYEVAMNSVEYFVRRNGKLELHTVDLPTSGVKDPTTRANDVPATPIYTIPVMLLVDDDERGVRRVWEKRLKERLAKASKVFEHHCRVRFVPVAMATWITDNDVNDFGQALGAFERRVNPLPARLAVGFTSQYGAGSVEHRIGGIRGPMRPHILIREWAGHLSEPERLEVLIHELGHFLGAAHSPDPTSAMRSILGDGRAKARSFRLKLDPLNTLVTYRIGEELRRGSFQGFGKLRPEVKGQLAGVYRVLAEALPKDESIKQYAQLLDPTANRPTESAESAEPAGPLVEGTRVVVRAITEAAAAGSLRGDRLTEQCIRRAAAAAAELPPDIAAQAFLLGIGIAMDNEATLSKIPILGAQCRASDTPQQENARRTTLRGATMRGRGDLLKHFVVSAGLTVLVGPRNAQTAGIAKELKDSRGGSGFSFVDLLANLSGIEFAAEVRKSPDTLAQLAKTFEVASHLPQLADLPEGIPWQHFLRDYGSAQDNRFQKMVDEIRRRIRALGANERGGTGS